MHYAASTPILFMVDQSVGSMISSSSSWPRLSYVNGLKVTYLKSRQEGNDELERL